MAHPRTSKKRAKAISSALFLTGLAIVLISSHVWPLIMLVIGVPLAIRQFLLGRDKDMLVSLFVFLGVYITAQFDVSWQILLPVLFIMGAIYILAQEFLTTFDHPESEDEEDLNHRIEEKDL